LLQFNDDKEQESNTSRDSFESLRRYDTHWNGCYLITEDKSSFFCVNSCVHLRLTFTHFPLAD